MASAYRGRCFDETRCRRWTPCREPCREVYPRRPRSLRHTKPLLQDLSGTWDALTEAKNSTGILNTFKRIVLCIQPFKDGSGDMFITGYEHFNVINGGSGHDSNGESVLSDKEYLSGVYRRKTNEIRMVETEELGWYQGTWEEKGKMTLIFLQAGERHVVSIMKLRKISTSTEGCQP